MCLKLWMFYHVSMCACCWYSPRMTFWASLANDLFSGWEHVAFNMCDVRMYVCSVLGGPVWDWVINQTSWLEPFGFSQGSWRLHITAINSTWSPSITSQQQTGSCSVTLSSQKQACLSTLVKTSCFHINFNVWVFNVLYMYVQYTCKYLLVVPDFRFRCDCRDKFVPTTLSFPVRLYIQLSQISNKQPHSGLFGLKGPNTYFVGHVSGKMM